MSRAVYPSPNDLLRLTSFPFAVEATYFQLFNRVKHVFSEARRVLQFRKTCLEAAQSSTSNDTVFLESLGRLMNDSQTSCSQLYECSCPELDQLTHLAREAGAYGSRLTGEQMVRL